MASKHSRPSLKIPQAELWSPDTPRVYRLVTRLAARGEHDEVETPFGVRFFTEQKRPAIPERPSRSGAQQY